MLYFRVDEVCYQLMTTLYYKTIICNFQERIRSYHITKG